MYVSHSFKSINITREHLSSRDYYASPLRSGLLLSVDLAPLLLHVSERLVAFRALRCDRVVPVKFEELHGDFAERRATLFREGVDGARYQLGARRADVRARESLCAPARDAAFIVVERNQTVHEIRVRPKLKVAFQVVALGFGIDRVLDARYQFFFRVVESFLVAPDVGHDLVDLALTGFFVNMKSVRFAIQDIIHVGNSSHGGT